jgi:hypothetical protein
MKIGGFEFNLPEPAGSMADFGTLPPPVVPRRSHRPSRPNCIARAEKHLGAPPVLLVGLADLADTNVSPRRGFSRRLRACGHPFEGEDESHEWPELRAARLPVDARLECAGRNCRCCQEDVSAASAALTSG